MKAIGDFFNKYINFNIKSVISQEEKIDLSSQLILTKVDKQKKVITTNLDKIPSSFQFQAEIIKPPTKDKNTEKLALQITLKNDIEPQTLFLQAINTKVVGLAKLLLTADPTFINLRTEKGRTLMHKAVDKDDWSMLELFLKEGGDVLACDKQGVSLLHLSASQGFVSLSAHLMTSSKALIEMRDKEGQTPLHFAAKGGHLEVAALLLNSRAWLEPKDVRGFTPLHTAAAHGKDEFIEFLLSRGANYQALDKIDRLPENVVEEKVFPTTKFLLIQHRQKYNPPNHGEHQTYTGQLTKTPYLIMDTLSQTELEEFENQTGIHVEMPQGENKYAWPKKQGNFGAVGLARNMCTGQFVACKTIRGKEKVQESINESKLQKFLEGQPYLMPLFDFTNDEKNSVLTEYMLWAEIDGLDLKNRLTAIQQPELFGLDPLIKYKVLVHVARALLTAIQCMHQLNIYHRDIKTENLLIDRFFRVYLSDFGQSIESATEQLKGTSLKADRHFLSPEVAACLRMQAETYDGKQADGWAAGLVLLEIGGFFNTMEHFHRDIKDLTKDYINATVAKIPILEKPKPQSLFALIKRLLAPNPKDRLSIAAALNYPIFQNPLYQFTSDEEQTEEFRLISQADLTASNNPSSKNSNQNFYVQSPKELMPCRAETKTSYMAMKVNASNVSPNKNKETSDTYRSYDPKLNLNNLPNSSKVQSLINRNVENGREDYNNGKKAFDQKKYFEAVVFFEKALNDGYKKSSTYLGLIYRRGDENISCDKPRAAKYLEEGVKAGHVVAMNELGKMLEVGDGVSMNQQEALNLYKKSRDAGDLTGKKLWEALDEKLKKIEELLK